MKLESFKLALEAMLFGFLPNGTDFRYCIISYYVSLKGEYPSTP